MTNPKDVFSETQLNLLIGNLKIQLDRPTWICSNCIKEVEMSKTCPTCGRNHIIVLSEDVARNLMNSLSTLLRLEDKYLFNFDLNEEEITELKNKYGVETKIYEIWAEGYIATGERGQASLIGKESGISFEDACKKFFFKNPRSYYNETSNTLWGCNLYDNEADARKFAG